MASHRVEYEPPAFRAFREWQRSMEAADGGRGSTSEYYNSEWKRVIEKYGPKEERYKRHFIRRMEDYEDVWANTNYRRGFVPKIRG